MATVLLSQERLVMSFIFEGTIEEFDLAWQHIARLARYGIYPESQEELHAWIKEYAEKNLRSVKSTASETLNRRKGD